MADVTQVYEPGSCPFDGQGRREGAEKVFRYGVLRLMSGGRGVGCAPYVLVQGGGPGGLPLEGVVDRVGCEAEAPWTRSTHVICECFRLLRRHKDRRGERVRCFHAGEVPLVCGAQVFRVEDEGVALGHHFERHLGHVVDRGSICRLGGECHLHYPLVCAEPVHEREELRGAVFFCRDHHEDPCPLCDRLSDAPGRLIVFFDRSH